MDLPFFQIDAFTDCVFGGNPAAVVPMDYWQADTVLQAIAEENNLSETAFIVPEGDQWRIRWFTPRLEVGLCGHATLAAAWYLFREYPLLEHLEFLSRSGVLPVRRKDEWVLLDFPSRPFVDAELPAALEGTKGFDAVGQDSEGINLMLVFNEEEQVAEFRPNLQALSLLPHLGLIVTAPGKGETDFVSRYFAPRAGIDEDPVTGSAHCTLIPFWAARLGKLELKARQLSRRGGEIYCRYAGDRVGIGGLACLYASGTLHLP